MQEDEEWLGKNRTTEFFSTSVCGQTHRKEKHNLGTYSDDTVMSLDEKRQPGGGISQISVI